MIQLAALTLVQAGILTVDLTPATVVTAYLSSDA
jgi:hypothetical protein